MRSHRSRLSRLASWGLFLGALFTVGTGFEPGSLTRGGCEAVKDDYVAKFTVTVVDATTSAPLAGAQVTLGDDVRATDAAGAVVFPDRTAGTFTLAATHAGYRPASETVVVAKADPTWLVRLTPVAQSHTVDLPIADISVFQNDAINANHREDHTLSFESSAATQSNEATIVTFVDLNLAGIPADAVIQKVTLHGQLIVDCDCGPPNGGGPGSAPRDRVSPRSTQDEDILMDAFGVLQPWSQEDLNYRNKPVDFTEAPVATGVIAAATPVDAIGLKAFTMDLTDFVHRVRAGTLRAHGFTLAGRDIVGTAGAVQVLSIASSEYSITDHALRVTAEYTDAAGKTVELTLR